MTMWSGLVNSPRHRDDAELNLIPLIDIMSVLVSFLLIYTANVEVVDNSKSIEIPHSTAEVQPQPSVVVMITKDNLFVQGEVVASIAEIRGASTPLVEPLLRVLGRPSVDGPAANESREITVIADKSLPFDVVKRVMATCSSSAYGKISLAVLEKEQAVRAVKS